MLPIAVLITIASGGSFGGDTNTMYLILEIWRYRRVWREMISLWEQECSKSGIVLQPGERVEVEIEFKLPPAQDECRGA